MNELEKSILKTIIWFNMFDFPLTSAEVFNYIFTNYQRKVAWQPRCFTQLPITNHEIEQKLAELVNKKYLQTKDGLYFLPAREKIIETRKERYLESLKKIKLAGRAAKVLSVLPHIKAIILCNVLGYLNAKREDDIDFLILTSKGRIWTARFFSAGIFKILGLRANPKGKIQNKFCFSFYVAEDNLNLENLKLKNDPYFIWWFTGLLPVYDQGGYFEKFLKANEWVKGYLLNFDLVYLDNERKKYQIKAGLPYLKSLWEKIILNWDEEIYKKIQLKIMSPALKEKMNKSDGVVVSDKVLKFHLNDRRSFFVEEFEQNLKLKTENLKPFQTEN